MNSLRTIRRRVLEIVVRSLVRWPRRFGLFETILYLRLGTLEWLRRHREILGELERMRRAAGVQRLRVLDFGGLSGSLATAIRLYGLSRHYDVEVVDIEQDEIEAVTLRAPLTGKLAIEPEPPLPYSDKAFDVVVSSDVFEHIPHELRPAWADELARVAAIGQVHSVPCDSDDTHWNSSSADREFAAWYEATVGEPERWTVEHIRNGVPTTHELIAYFRPTDLRGLANTRIWMESMKLQYGSAGLLGRIRFILGYIRERERDRQPPFKACLIVTERRSPA